MKNNKDSAFHCALACSAILSVICAEAWASDAADAGVLTGFEDTRYTRPRYEVLQTLVSRCRRYGVVWSGGVARRFPDRISPRPIRTRWQRESDHPVYCSDVDAFKQLRVSDQPAIR
jgi:hypothetical protein